MGAWAGWAVLAAALLVAGGGGDLAAGPRESGGTEHPVPGPRVTGDEESSELRDAVERYSSDRSVLLRRYDAPQSAARRERLRAFYRGWQDALDQLGFASLGRDGQVDYILLRNDLGDRLLRLDREEQREAETGVLLPFAGTIVALHEARRRLEPIDPEALAALLDELAGRIDATREAVAAGAGHTKKDGAGSSTDAAELAKGSGAKDGPPEGEGTGKGSTVEPIETTITLAHRAAKQIDDLQETLKDWYGYYHGYHPLFTWWATEPYGRVDAALGKYAKLLREKVVGVVEGEDPPIVGDPIGRDALLEELRGEMIAYTPEELVAIAEREFAWCEERMREAAREMGFPGDWRAALEQVKNLHVGPGEQPDLIRDLAHEAVAFLEERSLLTIPPLAKEVWRMEMMSPERQKVAPFFLGGEVIQVSFPTDTMSHEDKLMSMRGNNIHFARATVHHELIPGHHLQGFMNERHRRYRRAFRTPFWTEGWALYWEMVLWDLDFPRSPEDRVGMLFWRMHRCARILFSLGFHLGTMTPEECVDFLVERVGHERANAEAEVRRSFEGSYPPLYQIAYMTGALQLRALRQELVDSGRMPEREFHDAVLHLGPIPVEMVRASLNGEPLAADFVPGWRFGAEASP